MPRAGVTVEKIVRLAAEITDEKGINEVTLYEISERLGIRPPSLYKHISGLPELKEKVSRYAAEMLKEQFLRAAIGRSGIDAIKEMGRSYIQFAQEHTGLYETIQWLNVMSNTQSGALFSDLVQLTYEIARSFGADELEASHIIRTMRSLAHGFASIASHQGFSHESSVRSSYEYALDTLVLGIQARRRAENSNIRS